MNKRNVDIARRALARLKPEHRRALMREFGDCTCTAIAKSAAERPAIAIGAVVGGILGAFLVPGHKVLSAGLPPETRRVLKTATIRCPNCGEAVHYATDHAQLKDSENTYYYCRPQRTR